jgi:hypothetical protein
MQTTTLHRNADNEVTQQPNAMQLMDNNADDGQWCRRQRRHPDDGRQHRQQQHTATQMTRWCNNQPEKRCCGIGEGKGSGGSLGDRGGSGSGEVGGGGSNSDGAGCGIKANGGIDLYISGRMLGSKENLDLMLSSSPFVVVGLVLLNDAHRKERK